jgi:CRP-like cAMP-binding protein
MTGVFDNELSTAGVPIELIASMCRSARRVRLADRAALYAQGEPANALFLILDGFVKTSRICEDGTEITIELLKYGDIAGAIPNRQLPSEHEETARAIGDVVVCAPPWKSIPVWRFSSPNTWPDRNDRLSGGCSAR